MATENENLILEHLRAMRQQMDRIENEVGDLKLRVGAIEGHTSTIQVEIAGQNKRLDRIDERINRIERRLDLAEV